LPRKEITHDDLLNVVMQKKVELHNTKYENKRWFLEIGCIDCGKKKWISLSNLKKNKVRCKECGIIYARRNSKILDDEIIERLKPIGIKLLEIKRTKTSLMVRTTCIDCGKDKENFISLSTITTKGEGMRCISCGDKNRNIIKTFPNENKNFINNDKYNWSKQWDYINNKERTPENTYSKTSQEYYFICENCGESFLKGLSHIRNEGVFCNDCVMLQVESKMASALKQVFRHEYPDTIWEANLGAKYKNNLPYDIYVPTLNLIIECQSEYHDNEAQKKKDIIKKTYAIEHKYNFVEIDHRDYKNILDAIQVFFPHIKEIPEYIKFFEGVKRNWDLEKVQWYLDNTELTYGEIADKMGINSNIISSTVHNGSLINNRLKIKWDVEKAQSLLDTTNMTYKEIAKEVDVPFSTIASAVDECRLVSSREKRKWQFEDAQKLIINTSLTYEEIANSLDTTKGAIQSAVNHGNLISRRKLEINKLGGITT